MHHVLRTTLASILVLSAAGLALAQGGRGGPGMGGMGVAMIVQSKVVQDELKLKDEQKDKLKDFSKEQMAKLFEGKKKERPKKEDMIAKMAEAEKTAFEDLGKILDADQVKRLKQISYQVGGPNTLTRPDVVEALKIKDDQKEKIEEAIKTYVKEMTDLREESGMGFGEKPDEDKRKEFDKKAGGLHKETMEKIQGLLTDDQKKSWKDMTGESFDVAAFRADIQKVMRERFGEMRKKKEKE